MHKNIIIKLSRRALLLLPVFLVLITLAVYLPLFNGFFQHDEWRAFGHYFSRGENLSTIFIPNVSHYAPLTKLFFGLYSSVFQLNFLWYALFSILAHLTIVYVSYVLFLRLFRNRILSFLSSLLFGLGASGHQATSWIAADINTHGAVIFGLLSLIILFNSNFKKIWLSIIFLVVSLLFKEITIAFFVLLPVTVYLFAKEKTNNSWSKYIKFVAAGLLYLTFRFSMVFTQRAHIEDRLVIETQSLSDVVGNIITFPAKIFAQSLIPTGQLLSFSRAITKMLPEGMRGLYGTTAFDIFAENMTLQVVNWSIFILGILLLVYTLRRAKDKTIKKAALFGFLFIILNSFIYVLSPGRTGGIPVIDSRNIYMPSIGSAVFIVSATYVLLKEKIIKVLLLLLPFLVLNVFWLEKELNFLANRGSERKEILEEIKNKYPDLPQKTVFYMASDKPFYGLPETEKIFPFETNLGYTLMIWYQPQEFFSRKLLDQTDFLYGLTEEGYKETGGRGFGYFRNWNSLIDAVRTNSLNKDSIIAFSYDSRTKSVEDITRETGEKVEKAILKGI